MTGSPPITTFTITGFNFSEEDFKKHGIRSFTMRHAFNLREGFRRKDFTISDRMIGKPPMVEGPNEGITVDNELLADNLFNLLDWNLADAVPSLEALRSLGGLEKVIADLYPE